MLAPGTVIGTGVVVAIGSVVSGTVMSGTIVRGNPANLWAALLNPDLCPNPP